MIKSILTFLIVFSTLSLLADSQNDNVSAASEKLEKILQESFDYNRSLLLSLQRIHDKKSAEKGIKNLEAHHLKWEETMKKIERICRLFAK